MESSPVLDWDADAGAQLWSCHSRADNYVQYMYNKEIYMQIRPPQNLTQALKHGLINYNDTKP